MFEKTAKINIPLLLLIDQVNARDNFVHRSEVSYTFKRGTSNSCILLSNSCHKVDTLLRKDLFFYLYHFIANEKIVLIPSEFISHSHKLEG